MKRKRRLKKIAPGGLRGLPGDIVRFHKWIFRKKTKGRINA